MVEEEGKSIGAPLSKLWPPPAKKPFLRSSGSGSRRPTALREIPNGGDSKRRKRVRFADVDAIHAFSCKLDSSTCPTRGTEASDYVPKTSEYSSYKKLMEEVGSSLHSHKQHNEVSQSKNYKVKSCKKEMKSAISSGNEISRLIFEELTPIDQTKFFPPTDMLKNPGMQCSTEGLFAEKRHDILKLASENLSLELESFVAKGFDVIPDFLYRLDIQSKSNSHTEILNSMQVNRVPESSYPKIHDGLPHILTGDNEPLAIMQRGAKTWLELYYDEKPDLNHFWQKNLEGRVFPTWHAHEKDVQYINKRASLMDVESMEPDIDIDSCRKCPYEGYLSVDTLLSEFECFSPANEPSKRRHLMKLSLVPCETFPQDSSVERSLVPVSNTRLLEFDELYNPDDPAGFTRGDECTPRLLGWVENEMILEEDSSFISDVAVRNMRDNVPCTSCSAPEFFGLDFQLISSRAGRNMLNYFPATSFPLFLDKTNLSLDRALVPFGSKFMSGSVSAMIDSSTRPCLSIHSDLQIQETGAVGTGGLDDDDGVGRFEYGECNFHNLLPDYFEICASRNSRICMVTPDDRYDLEGENIW